MKHKHADLMLEYAKQAQESEEPWRNWEVSYDGEGAWFGVSVQPSWNINIEYRMKKKTINIGGIEITEPVREPLNFGEEYYIPYLGDSSRVSYSYWQGDAIDALRLASGIIHRNKADAAKHAIALLGFTC